MPKLFEQNNESLKSKTQDTEQRISTNNWLEFGFIATCYFIGFGSSHAEIQPKRSCGDLIIKSH